MRRNTRTGLLLGGLVVLLLLGAGAWIHWAARQVPEWYARATASQDTAGRKKASNQMEDSVVLAKKEAAVKWCANASNHAHSYGGKPWRYVLIPHNEIATNMTLDALATRFGV